VTKFEQKTNHKRKRKDFEENEVNAFGDNSPIKKIRRF